jgi:hypothetical protein
VSALLKSTSSIAEQDFEHRQKSLTFKGFVVSEKRVEQREKRGWAR